MKIAFSILLLLLIIGAIGFVAYGRENTWTKLFGDQDLGPIDVTNLQRSKKPNDALMCSTGACADTIIVDEKLPAYQLSGAELIDQIEANMRESGLMYERVDERSDPNRIRFVVRTPTLRFADTVEFIAVDMGSEGTGLVGYARAQMGYSDMGNNLKHLKALTKNLGG